MSDIAQRYLDLINSGEAPRAVFDEVFAPNYVEHLGSQELTGPESQYQNVKATQAAFPDLHIDLNVTLKQSIPEGELWCSHWTLTGTHQGEFNGIPATGKKVNVTGMSIWKIVDGKNVEEWEIVDSMAMMQQLGVIPAPGEGEG
jgi:steroid delta-isomerase-like uncharacterized protein